MQVWHVAEAQHQGWPRDPHMSVLLAHLTPCPSPFHLSQLPRSKPPTTSFCPVSPLPFNSPAFYIWFQPRSLPA